MSTLTIKAREALHLRCGDAFALPSMTGRPPVYVVTSLDYAGCDRVAVTMKRVTRWRRLGWWLKRLVRR